ncbi:membrane peptidoglycan carboxypeptidase [Bogoriella caseilytica]|uniref:Membrane peptidoglycan carboxypeptidase n=2 Tax=Bogoriella caseilytica TaxID=56055 RepID=A0A3N2BD61_9MICO|nr:membrane peptidoglycan carboxypeptidase [Bogoriella caseilytica]
MLALLLTFVLVAGLGGVLAAGLMLPALGAVGTATQATEDMFDEIPDELAIPEPSQRSEILWADGSRMASIYADNRVVVPLDQMNPHLRNAVVAIEDRRFYDHRGVDPEGIARAFVNNLAGGSLEGASTITQQYVKNALIEHGRITGDADLIREAQDESYGRKLAEAQMAISLEQQLTKDQILEGYLNLAQFGRSQYGVEAAAQYYFGKPAADVTPAEAATLAGITQSPAAHDPERYPEQSERRRNTVLSVMRAQGFLSEAEYQEARDTPMEEMLTITPAPNGCQAARSAAYFCEYVVDELLQHEEWLDSREERRDALYRGGLIIHTTLDRERQVAAYESVTASVPVGDPSNIRMALSSVDPTTGDIQAMAQNTNFGSPSEEDSSATSVNLNVGLSHGGGRGFQGGSTHKVFALIEWLREGGALEDTITVRSPTGPDGRREFEPDEWSNSCDAANPGSVYPPRNIEGTGSDVMTVHDATRMSINLPFVEMATQIDLCAMMDTAAAMGLERADGNPLLNYPSTVLGSNEITPLSQAVAFGTLANDGIACAPRAITSIENHHDEELATFETSCERALESSVVNAANHSLQAVIDDDPYATGRSAILPEGRSAAGKTGTANDASASWFVGYTPEQLSTAVWMGYQEATGAMTNVTVDGQHYDWIFGSHIPAPTWRDYMARALDGEPQTRFGEVGERELEGERRRVPSVTGQSIGQAEDTLEQAGFSTRVGSGQYSSAPFGTVAGTSPGGGTEVRGAELITIHPSAGPPPASTNNTGGDDDDGDDSEDSDGDED